MHRIHACVVTLVCLLSCFVTGPAQASDWGIVVNGKAYHVNSTYDWNENNWGLGFEREFNQRSRWVRMAVGSGFIDSQNSMSYMGGGGLKRRFLIPRIGQDFYVDIGAVAFLMTRQDINNNKPFPGLLPTLTVGSRHIAVNLAYLPGSVADAVSGIRTIDPNIDAIYFVQLRLSPRLFTPMGSRLRTALASRH
jgi:hypothetical protein